MLKSGLTFHVVDQAVEYILAQPDGKSFIPRLPSPILIFMQPIEYNLYVH
jgi:hypothetical protein